MLKIAIGTDSTYKVNAIKRAILNLDIDAEFTFAKVASEISEQPNKRNETREGAENRAKNVIKKFPECDLGIGVEFGYEPDGNSYKAHCWASIVTAKAKKFSEQSSTIELPLALKEALEKDNDVSDTLSKKFIDTYRTEAGRKYMELMKKRRMIYESVENVMLRYLFDKEFY